MSEPAMRVLFWGTYDLSKPRNRILRDALSEAGAEVIECHEPVWEEVADKSLLGRAKMAAYLARMVRAYPRLIARFVAQPPPDVVLVGYLGQLDVLVVFALAKLRGLPVVWDQFISLYNTVVEDRRLVGPRHPLAKALWAWEWLSVRAADRVWMDTHAHADYVARLLKVSRQRLDAVWVGAEEEQFFPAPRSRERSGDFRVLFYGQFSPLHGLGTILEAARLLADEPFEFVVVGQGQGEPELHDFRQRFPEARVEWLGWVAYEQLNDELNDCDVALGIFGDTEKAARVIPNKVFQIVASGRPLITRDSPAVRELFPGAVNGLWLVPPADATALAAALREARALGLSSGAFSAAAAQIDRRAIGASALRALERVREERRRLPVGSQPCGAP